MLIELPVCRTTQIQHPREGDIGEEIVMNMD